MATYDQHTQAFMDGVQDEHQRPISGEAIARKAATVVGAIIQKKPVSRMIMKEIVKDIVKEGSISILSLYEILSDHYGRDWWDWLPETLWHHLANDHGVLATEELRNAVQAIQMMLTTNQAHENWHIFEKTVHALNLEPVDFKTLQPCEPDRIARALRLMTSIRPQQEYDSEVIQYIAACCHHAGLCYAPPSILSEEINGALDQHVVDHELAEETRAAWPAPSAGTGTPLDVQLARLHEIQEYRASG